MPTENELKYLLDINCEKEIAEKSVYKQQISQSYLHFDSFLTVRIRKTNDSYVLTVKVNQGRTIEIEKEIDSKDFFDLWETSILKLNKTRYDIMSEEGKWEVDVFKDGEETYFILAEHEMPEGKKEPNSIPDIILKHLIYAVPAEDNRFFSGKLSDKQYAEKLYKKMVKYENK